MNIEGDPLNKPAYLQIHSIGEMAVDEQRYFLVMRDALHDMRLLSTKILSDQDDPDFVPMNTEEKEGIANDIMKTLAELHKRSDNFGYGEITPFNIILGQHPVLNRPVVKIVDTYCDRYLRSIDENFKESRESVQRDSFCKIDAMRNRKKNYPQVEEDMWGCWLTMFSIFTGRLYFQNERQEDLESEITEFTQKSEDAKSSDISKKMSTCGTKSDLLKMTMTSMVKDKIKKHEIEKLSGALEDIVRKKAIESGKQLTQKEKEDVLAKSNKQEEADEKKAAWEKEALVESDENCFIKENVAELLK